MTRSSRLGACGAMAAGGLLMVGLAAWKPPAALGVLVLFVLLRVATAPLVADPLTRPPAPTDPAAAIEQELGRSRRHRRPCSLVRLCGPPGPPLELCGSLRRSDQAWRIGRDVIILMPESGRDSANIGVRRLCSHATSIVATFPDDGVTVQALVDVVLAPQRPEWVVQPSATPELGPRVEPLGPG